MLTCGMHGVASYLMDQKGLLHADPADPTATAAVWDALARARVDVEKLQAAAPAGPQLQPEVGLYPIVILPYSSTTLYQVFYHIK